jgi:hypothetical protein
LITVPFVAAGHAPCPPIALHLLRGRTRLLLVLHMTSRAQHRVYSDCTGTIDPLRKPTLDDGGASTAARGFEPHRSKRDRGRGCTLGG